MKRQFLGISGGLHTQKIVCHQNSTEGWHQKRHQYVEDLAQESVPVDQDTTVCVCVCLCMQKFKYLIIQQVSFEFIN